ncbi:alpha/beta hydrolase [Sinorhizobium fredii]|uniref:alpha/beta hydrolase n=1 Tax=Rhizobium fredii TaxID=380 RepID=UPI00351284CA
MRSGTPVVLALASCLVAAPVQAQQSSEGSRVEALVSDTAQRGSFRTLYSRLSEDTEALLYEPAVAGPNASIAVVFSHSNRDNFDAPVASEMARRGYRALMVNYRGDRDNPDAVPEAFLPSISQGIAYLRTLPGVRRVVLVAHSGGGHLATLYQNVAEHGPSACQGPEKIYPCLEEGITHLEKPDGLVLLDPTLGAAHQMTAIDPAVAGDGRDPALDMFAAENGYSPGAKGSKYSPEFASRFHQAQAARNKSIVDGALERLRLISAGEGEFSNDEPILIRGIGVRALGARLYQPDISFVAHTKRKHLLLSADGSETEAVVQSVRPPLTREVQGALRELGVMNYDTTVRGFLANSAIRTQADFAITADDIVGLDWASSYTSTPANAEGVSVPALVLTMSCHYLVVPGEIIFDHLSSKDKTYAAVEGATHLFKPCRPEYGDTVKRVFDFVDGWLGKEGRLPISKRANTAG